MIEEVVSVSGKRYEELARWHDESIFRVIRHHKFVVRALSYSENGMRRRYCPRAA